MTVYEVSAKTEQKVLILKKVVMQIDPPVLVHRDAKSLDFLNTDPRSFEQKTTVIDNSGKNKRIKTEISFSEITKTDKIFKKTYAEAF